MKGIFTDCHTGEEREVYLDYKIIEIKGEKIFQLVNGPTGYESFYITSVYPRLEKMCENGWTACCGTKGVWDKLFISAEEMKEALAPFLDRRT